MNVPFCDLKAQYLAIKPEIDTAIQSVLEQTAFIGGKPVEAFERAFSDKYGMKHCISCASGTDAIYITLRALGVGFGDEVITVANGWISTSEAVSRAGARPVFIDIDEYFHIDPAKIESRINKKTKAVIPVHLFGQPADIKAVRDVCERHKLHLIENCAQSPFATTGNLKVGTFGIAGTFSFHPGMNLGAYGDGGAIVTDDEDLARTARLYANHGSYKKYIHEIEGINSRLDGIQAAILSIKLEHIDEWNQNRNSHALKYNALLGDIWQVRCPKFRPGTFHVFHLYVIRVPRRDDLAAFLKDRGIICDIHYPIALPFMPAYRYLGHRPSDYPSAYECQEEILSLPIYPEITDDQIAYVADCIGDFFRG